MNEYRVETLNAEGGTKFHVGIYHGDVLVVAVAIAEDLSEEDVATMLTWPDGEANVATSLPIGRGASG